MSARVENNLTEAADAISRMHAGDIPSWNRTNKLLDDTLKLIISVQKKDKKAGNAYVVQYNDLLSRLEAKLPIVQKVKKAPAKKKKKVKKKKSSAKALTTAVAEVELDSEALASVEAYEELCRKVDDLGKADFSIEEYHLIVKDREQVEEKYHQAFQIALNKYGMKSSRLMEAARQVSDLVTRLEKYAELHADA